MLEPSRGLVPLHPASNLPSTVPTSLSPKLSFRKLLAPNTSLSPEYLRFHLDVVIIFSFLGLYILGISDYHDKNFILWGWGFFFPLITFFLLEPRLTLQIPLGDLLTFWTL